MARNGRDILSCRVVDCSHHGVVDSPGCQSQQCGNRPPRMFHPCSDCASSHVAFFADAVRSESVSRRCRGRGGPFRFSWTDLSRRLCVVLHARQDQGAANGNSDYQRWTIHVVDTDADCPDPLTTSAP